MNALQITYKEISAIALRVRHKFLHQVQKGNRSFDKISSRSKSL
jgi:hypothetical protein